MFYPGTISTGIASSTITATTGPIQPTTHIEHSLSPTPTASGIFLTSASGPVGTLTQSAAAATTSSTSGSTTAQAGIVFALGTALAAIFLSL